MKLFELFATLGIDTAQFDAGLNQAITNTKGVREALSKLSQEATQTGKAGGEAAGFFKRQWQDVKDSLNGIFTVSAGQLVAQGATAAFGWLKQTAKDSIDLASDLNEVQNVIDTTFGSDAKTIERWAKNAKNSIGMSELAAKRYAGTMGAMLKSSGLTGEQVTEFSKQMVDLAGDMASFYNLDHDTAFEKIRSGISGETEPLKQLGVNMSVANLEAFRLQQGIETAYDKMSQGEQVELRMKYLAQAMKDASGDFERTASSYANSKKTLEANVQTLESNIGQFILPVVQDAVGAVNALFEGDQSVSAKIAAIDQELQGEEVENMLKVSAANALIDELAAMEGQTDRTAEEQARWQAILEKLVQTVPTLSDKISLETGEIEGGTAALRENTKAWEENLRIQAIKSAGSQYQDLLATAISTAAEAKVEDQIAQIALDELRPRLEELYGKTWAAKNTPFAEWVNRPSYSGLSRDEKTEADLLRQRYIENQHIVAEYNRNAEQYQADIEAAAEKNRLYNETYAEYLESVTAGPGVSATATIETLPYTAEEYTAALEQEMTTAEGLRDKIEELADAHEELRQATEQSVNSLLGGWKKVDAINGMTGEGKDAVAFNLNDYVETLKAQKTFADQYRNMLEDLRGNENVSQDLLSYLAANVTEENAEILNAIHTNPVGDQARAISQAYNERNAANLKLVNESTSLQTEFSSTIQGLEDEVKTMAEAWNQQEAARASMRDTVQGGVEGLEDSLPDLQSVMDEIRSAVETGLNWSNIQVRLPNIAGAASSLADAVSGLKNLGGRLGNLNFAPVQLEERAVGLDYVPYDGYVAALHEGERVMTKLENRQFSAGELGGTNADLGGLPGLIVAAVRDGMANISVQIDGQEAGRILIEPISRGIAERARNGRYAG